MRFVRPPDASRGSPVDAECDVGVDGAEEHEDPHEEDVTDEEHDGDGEEEEPERQTEVLSFTVPLQPEGSEFRIQERNI